LLGPERCWEHEINSERIQLPETGPQGRIYRQLDEVGRPRRRIEREPARTAGDK